MWRSVMFQIEMLIYWYCRWIRASFFLKRAAPGNDHGIFSMNAVDLFERVWNKTREFIRRQRFPIFCFVLLLWFNAITSFFFEGYRVRLHSNDLVTDPPCKFLSWKDFSGKVVIVFQTGLVVARFPAIIIVRFWRPYHLHRVAASAVLLSSFDSLACQLNVWLLLSVSTAGWLVVWARDMQIASAPLIISRARWFVLCWKQPIKHKFPNDHLGCHWPPPPPVGLFFFSSFLPSLNFLWLFK